MIRFGREEIDDFGVYRCVIIGALGDLKRQHFKNRAENRAKEKRFCIWIDFVVLRVRKKKSVLKEISNCILLIS